MQPTDINKIPISFQSSQLTIRGWLFRPTDSPEEKLPAIVMAPGFSGVKECNYQFYAEIFAKEGFAVLLFDYPNFGESEVSIKGEIDPWQQVQAYRDGISYLETRTDIDVTKVGVWGGSYSGAHSLVVGALDHRVKCLVAMTPFISGGYHLKAMPPQIKTYLQSQFDADRTARIKGEKPEMIPVASDDKMQLSAISSPYVLNFIEQFTPYAPNYENAVTLKSLEMQLEYEPGYYVPRIGDIPKLFMIAIRDELIPASLIIEAYARASEPKIMHFIDGHHFSPYMEKLQEAAGLAIEWFKEHLR